MFQTILFPVVRCVKRIDIGLEEASFVPSLLTGSLLPLHIGINFALSMVHEGMALTDALKSNSNLTIIYIGDTNPKTQQGYIRKMKTHDVVEFTPYPFKVGQKLHIDGGARGGDWEVVGVTDRKVKLRCPISFREFEWVNFCFFVEEKSGKVWPKTE